MNHSRFWQQAPTPRDSEIIKRATRLKVDLYKDGDGDFHGEFTIRGGFGLYGESDYDDPAEFDRQQSDFMRFVRELLAEFERRPDDASGQVLGA